ncbi:hypothetical protein BDQ17DRAFT_1414137 [Cyathus striatus]|nr:hypothetical protein BDQ17DRAFT_1414137 [Cyathus striatus]
MSSHPLHTRSFTSIAFNDPDVTAEPEHWNSFWEDLITDERVYRSFVDCTLSQERWISNRDAELFEHYWKAWSSSKRRKHMLEGFVRSLYPNPKWADEMKEDLLKDKNSMRAVMWEMMQLDRGMYICEFLYRTLESCEGPPPPSPPIHVKTHVLGMKEINNLTLAKFKKLKDKDLAEELRQHFKGSGKESNYACEVCSKVESSRTLLKKYQRCIENIDWKVYYCSPACQKNDWPIHKKICGKVHTTETARNIFVPRRPPPYYIPRYSVCIPDDPTLKMAFDEACYFSIIESDCHYIIILAQHLIRRGVDMTGATDLTEQNIISQLQVQFPTVYLSKSIDILDQQACPPGITILEYIGELLQALWEEEYMNPENGIVKKMIKETEEYV